MRIKVDDREVRNAETENQIAFTDVTWQSYGGQLP